MEIFAINPNGYVCYYRVSTIKQSLRRKEWWDNQEYECYKFLSSKSAKIIGSFRDVASGAEKERPGLAEAVKLCKQTDATLFATRVDRIARCTKIIAGLMRYGIKMDTVQTCKATWEDKMYYASIADAIYERDYKDKYDNVFELMFPEKETCDKELIRVLGYGNYQQIRA